MARSAVRLLRSLRAHALRARPGPRRPPAPSRQPRDGDLPVRGRDPPPRQPRFGAGDPSRRRELDERRPRHRALGANPARRAGRRLVRAWPAALGRAPPRARGVRARVSPLPGGDAADVHERGRRDPCPRRRSLRAALAGRDLLAGDHLDISWTPAPPWAAGRRSRASVTSSAGVDRGQPFSPRTCCSFSRTPRARTAPKTASRLMVVAATLPRAAPSGGTSSPSSAIPGAPRPAPDVAPLASCRPRLPPPRPASTTSSRRPRSRAAPSSLVLPREQAREIFDSLLDQVRGPVDRSPRRAARRLAGAAFGVAWRLSG